MKICVFGAGSLGTLVGGVLARTHEVTLVGREPHVSTINTEGLQITGEITESVRPNAGTSPPASADLAVLTVKSFDTAEAAHTLAECSLGGVLSLQNGMGNEERLVEMLSCPVLAGTCTYGARLSGPGVVECTGEGEIVLGPYSEGSGTLAERVGTAFKQAGLTVTVSGTMTERLWEKLAVNAGINATTALARIPNGALREGPAGETADEAARETARVATANGIDLDESAAVEQLQTVARQTASNTSSMQQDLLGDARTEIDAINGYVLREAENQGVAVPVNRTLTALVRGWESERGLRE